MAAQIPFTRGVPSADLLPIDWLREAADTALRSEPARALAYADGGGHPDLRAWIGEQRGVDAARVICTNGSLQALLFLGELLLDGASSRRALVEAPSYDRAILLLRRAGADVAGIPLDEHGLDVDALEADVRTNGAPALLYAIPTFQNPSGATLSLERRRRLVALAAEHGFPIVEDDPYGLLRWRGDDLPTLLELGAEAGASVVAMSSFTKTVAPGIRVGYAIAPEELAPRLLRHATNTYISPSMLSQSTLAAYCRAGHFEPHVEAATAALGERCAAMASAVRAHFPDGSRFEEPDGGYFLWVELPEGIDTSALLAEATAAGVPYVRGADFYPRPEDGLRSLRLAFSAVPPDQIAEGVERLGGVLGAALRAAPAG